MRQAVSGVSRSDRSIQPGTQTEHKSVPPRRLPCRERQRLWRKAAGRCSDHYNYSRHQISSAGKRFHISRWLASISSSRKRVAWLRISCCLMIGNARTASRMACSTDMINLSHFIALLLSNARRMPCGINLLAGRGDSPTVYSLCSARALRVWVVPGVAIGEDRREAGLNQLDSTSSK